MRKFEYVDDDVLSAAFDGDSSHMNIILPKRGTKKSAGYDFFAPFDIHLEPYGNIIVPTGICAQMEDDEMLLIVPRSGLGFKYSLRLANTIGVIDADYYGNPKNGGHIMVKMRNEGNKPLDIKAGDGFCQGIFMKYLLVDDDNFSSGSDRNGGFGSTTKPD